MMDVQGFAIDECPPYHLEITIAKNGWNSDLHFGWFQEQKLLQESILPLCIIWKSSHKTCLEVWRFVCPLEEILLIAPKATMAAQIAT